jgi:tripeptide aminopeptidase
MINNYSNLYNVMNVQSASYSSERMERFIRRRIKKLGLQYELDNYGNIYVTKGKADLYPTMVCHVDTVHEINDNAIVQKADNKLYAFDTKTMTQYGIGGDDKVGIYVTLQLLEHFKTFKAVFFKDEEVGCVGSAKANFDFFNDSTIVLQCDRQGNTDFVNNIAATQLYDQTLQKDIKAILDYYHRKETTGGLTDVLKIADNNPVMVANMSCGYFNPHTDTEYIDIEDVYQTTLMCAQILKATSHKRYEMTRTKKYPTYNQYGTTLYNKNYNAYDWDDFESSYPKSTNTNNKKYCCNCGLEGILDEYEDTIYCQTCETISYVEPYNHLYYEQ